MSTTLIDVETGNEVASGLAGIVGILIAVAVLVLTALWIIFPSIVISRFSELLKVQREIRAALRSANDAQSGMAKALQWIVDNWKFGDANSPHPPPPPPI